MFLTFKDRDTPSFTTFSQLLIRDQVQCCKLNMLIYITNVSVVFPSSPGSISVVFPMFSMWLRSLHLFVYSFESVIQVHYIASIHLRGRHECEKWKIRLCSTCRVLNVYGFMKMQVQRMDTVPFEALGTWKQLFVSVWQRLWQRHPAGTWAIHPKTCWIEVQNIYNMTQTSCNWGNMNLLASIIWMTPSKCIFSRFSCWKLPLLTFICYLEALKNRTSSGTWLVHPSSPHLWLRWKFFQKIRSIFPHHLVALSSCNTRFEGEKWELSELKYSGEMQLFQKDFDMKKIYVNALLARKTYTEYRKTYQSSILVQDVPFLKNLNHKT